MGSKSSVQAELHHERLSVGELLLVAVEGHDHEQVFAQDPLYYLQVFVWVVGLVESLLSIRAELTLRTQVDAAAVKQPFFLLLRALLEEDFPEHVFFLFVRVIVLHVVVVRLVENTVRIVVAVGVFVPDPPRLMHL